MSQECDWKIMEYQKFCSGLLYCEEDAEFMETYISYITFLLQKQIIEKVRKKKTPGNGKKIQRHEAKN
jgi:hypothetical protein